MTQVDLSFVIPAYNEEEYIEETLSEVNEVAKGSNLPYEIIVVDDGSKDGTFLKATRYAWKHAHVRMVHFVANNGKGYALNAGFMHADGDIVIFADGDMDIDLHLISQYLAALEHSDIVIASKWHPQSQVKMPLRRKLLSHGFNVLVRVLTGVPLKDTQAGLKAMRRTAFECVFPKLSVKRYAFDVELLAVARLYGLKVAELPVDLKIDASFKFRDVWKMLLDLLGIAYRLRIIHWYQHSTPARNSLQKTLSFVLRENEWKR